MSETVPAKALSDLGNFANLGPPAIAHSIGHFELKIAKEWKGLCCGPLLPHEYRRRVRAINRPSLAEVEGALLS
jgi:hypothetical protein